MTIQNIWLMLLLPALGFITCALADRPGRKQWAGWVATAMVAASFVASLAVWGQLIALPLTQQQVPVTLWPWVVAGDLVVQFTLLVDPLSVLMLLIITGVGALIHLYAIAYMHGDAGVGRFFAGMNLFILAMNLLVLAGNFLLLMVGWGGVGLASYLLIAFWFEKDENAKAGVKAFVVNSIGDVGLMVACFLIFTTFGSLDFDVVFKGAESKLPSDSSLAVGITLALLLAAIAKSGQIPLHVWLPDAMAGPTPVSALIHAATMVTAGVYLIGRAHPLFERAPSVMLLVATIGAVTALFAATVGLVQTNIKRVLAYSTVSQLGYMFLAAGLGGFSAAVFHLTTHAFFKAALFLGAGAVIHALHGEEDLFRMGALRKRLPWIYVSFVIGAAALAGIFPLAGFWSKDEILQAAFDPAHGNLILGVLAMLTVALTGFYSMRAVALAFHGEPHEEHAEPDVSHLRKERRRQQVIREHTSKPHEIHEPSPLLVWPTAILAALAAVGGLLALLVPGYLLPVFTRYAHDPQADASHTLGPVFFAVMGASTVLALGGIGLGYLFYIRQPDLPGQWTQRFPAIYTLLSNRWYFDRAYELIFVGPCRKLGDFVGRGLDPLVIDEVVQLVGRAARGTAGQLSLVQSGFLRSYAASIVAGTIVVLIFVLVGMGR